MNVKRIFLLAFAIIFAVFTSELIGSGMAQEEKIKSESAAPLSIGDKATDFELEGINGKVKLSDRFGANGRPVVLLFSRANW